MEGHEVKHGGGSCDAGAATHVGISVAFTIRTHAFVWFVARIPPPVIGI